MASMFGRQALKTKSELESDRLKFYNLMLRVNKFWVKARWSRIFKGDAS